MSGRFWLIAFAVILIACSYSPASAQQEDNRLTDKARLGNISTTESCSEYWNLLWSRAKKGDIEARVSLLFMMASPPDSDSAFPPGNSGDLVSRMRDVTVMAVHSESYREKWPKEYKDAINGFYIHSGFDKSPAGRKFLECLEDTRTRNCTDIAVSEKLVPSFDDYAKQIDAFLKAGMKTECG